MTGLALTMERTTGFEPATPDLGKVVLYQLSHVRIARKYDIRTYRGAQVLFSIR